VVATEMSDVSGDVGVHLQAITTLLSSIHVSLPKCNTTTIVGTVLVAF
jgi:hypothetical protein